MNTHTNIVIERETPHISGQDFYPTDTAPNELWDQFRSYFFGGSSLEPELLKKREAWFQSIYERRDQDALVLSLYHIESVIKPDCSFTAYSLRSQHFEGITNTAGKRMHPPEGCEVFFSHDYQVLTLPNFEKDHDQMVGQRSSSFVGVCLADNFQADLEWKILFSLGKHCLSFKHLAKIICCGPKAVKDVHTFINVKLKYSRFSDKGAVKSFIRKLGNELAKVPLKDGWIKLSSSDVRIAGRNPRFGYHHSDAMVSVEPQQITIITCAVEGKGTTYYLGATCNRIIELLVPPKSISANIMGPGKAAWHRATNDLYLLRAVIFSKTRPQRLRPDIWKKNTLAVAKL